MIDPSDIDAVAAHVDTYGPSDAVVMELRQRFPDYHFTVCLDEDIGTARPVRELGSFNLYLVDGANGCIGFTSDSAAATGMVIAETSAE